MITRPTPARRGMSPPQLAADQKARLEKAMVDAVSDHGYAQTTIRELVGLAGVSKSTFYQHFKSKQECFLATFEEIVERMGERVAAAFMQPGDLRQRLAAALSVFMELAVAEPAAVSIVVIDSLTLGAAGFARREQASRRFEELIEQGLGELPSAGAQPKLIAQTVIGGVRGVAYWRLRAGTQDELPGLVDELVEWTLSYGRAGGEIVSRAVAAAGEPAPPPPPRDEAAPGWDEPPDSPLSRRALTQRERLVRAAAQLAFERGFDALSIPAISGAAGVSNQTFYEHFEGKRDAFLAAFDVLAAETFGNTVAIFEAAGDRPEALGVGIRALLEHIAGNELFAKLAFFELPAAGPPAFDRGDAVLEAFTSFLQPGTAPSVVTEELPKVVREAIGSGIWAVLLFTLYNSPRERLPELAPEVTRLALTPLDPG